MPNTRNDSFYVLLAKFDLCIWKKDIAHNQYLYLSKGTAKLYGIPKTVLLKHPDAWLEVVHPDDLAMVRTSAEKLESIPTEVDITYRIFKPNGSMRWIRDLKRSFADETGIVVTVEGLAEDITHRKNIEEQLIINEKRYRFYFENNPKPMWVYDCQTLQFLEVNKAAISTYGFSREEFLNMKITDIRPQEEVSRLLKSVSKLKAGMNHSRTWTHLNKKGEYFKVEIAGYVFTTGQQKKELVVVNDVTNIANFAEKIETIAHYTSHEVRKPLANILALTSLMKEEKDLKRKEELCDTLASCAQELDEVLKRAAEIIRSKKSNNSLFESMFQ